MECFVVKQNTIALWDGRVGVISISQMGKQAQTERGSELHTHEEPDLALGPPNSLGLCESDALEMWLSPVPSRSPAVFTLPLDLYIAGPPTSQCIIVTVSSDTCSASLPWDISICGWGHSLGSDTSRSDQVRFNNMNCIHVSSEMLQESELLWGADMVSQQEILRKFVLDSSVDPGVCQAEENWLGAFYSMPLLLLAGLCSSWDAKSTGMRSLYAVCLIETVLLRNTNSPKKGSLGRTEKATLLRSSGRCYGINCVPSEVLTPSVCERDCVWR